MRIKIIIHRIVIIAKKICLFCEKSHNNHEIISFGKLIPDIDECKKNLIELKNNLEQFKKIIKKAIEKLNEIINKIIDNCESNYKKAIIL